MALARLITRTPEYAQNLARDLNSAGYTVEFLSPDEAAAAPAELEVNLDDASAASSYLVTADGREISFTYDEVEREFVLAPLWRKVKSLMAPLFARREREETPIAEQVDMVSRDMVPRPASPASAPVSKQIETTPEPQADRLEEPAFRQAVEAEPEPHAALPTEEPVLAQKIEAEPARPIAEQELPPEFHRHEPVQVRKESIYLPQSQPAEIEAAVEFTGVEFFDGHGIRRVHEPPAVPLAEPVATQETSGAAQSPREPWLVAAARTAQAAGSAFAARWKELPRPQLPVQLRSYDAAWLRAVPAAAIITTAFLLGWSFAGHDKASPSAPPVEAKPPIAEATVLPAATPAVADAAPKPVVSNMKPAAKKAAPRRSRAVEEDEFDDEVVVRHRRHYPSKGERAANEKGVRRYSDID
jgi:hypothetical protein